MVSCARRSRQSISRRRSRIIGGSFRGSRMPSGLRKTKLVCNSLAHRTTWLRSDFEGGEVDEAAVETLDKKFRAALDNDLNTSLAVTAIYDVLKFKTTDATKLHVLSMFDRVLGLDLIEKAAARREELKKHAAAASVVSVIFDSCEENAEIKALAEARIAAKKAKNFAEADRLRDEIIAKGYLIEDTAQGPKIRVK